VADRPLRFGVSGLGRGFMLMAPTFRADPRCKLVSAADPRPEARAAFAAEFGGRAYDTFEGMCADPGVEVVYIAAPHRFHAEQAILAAGAGKHILVEKPMALELGQCRAMIAAAEAAGVQLIVGPSHGFDEPVAMAARMIASGAHGAVRMIASLNYTDFLYRPRRPEELDTAQGGGVIFSQAAHQVDVARRLAGGAVTSVRAQAGVWDPSRPAEGAYSAFLTFAGGAVATLTYSGYDRFDSDEFMGQVGETGFPKPVGGQGGARRRLQAATDGEAALKAARTYGAGVTAQPEAAPYHEHFGLVLVSCERADLRLTPFGVVVHSDRGVSNHLAPPPLSPRKGVIDEVYGAVVEQQAPLHSGGWGMANLDVCLALLRSSAEGREITLEGEAP
jgi:phthalate 4,5-cis-dihydrodiol dehydrogenase